jgi:hypothetical protein
MSHRILDISTITCQGQITKHVLTCYWSNLFNFLDLSQLNSLTNYIHRKVKTKLRQFLTSWDFSSFGSFTRHKWLRRNWLSESNKLLKLSKSFLFLKLFALSCLHKYSENGHLDEALVERSPSRDLVGPYLTIRVPQNIHSWRDLGRLS